MKRISRFSSRLPSCLAARLDTLFATPSGPVKTNVPSHSEGSAPEGDAP